MKASKTITKVDSIKKAMFIENYRKDELMGNITKVCDILGIHRSTYYIWLEEDEGFRELMKEEKMKLCDLAESELFSRGLEKDTTALIYWLKNRHPDFKEQPMQLNQQFNIRLSRGEDNG